MYRSSIRSVQTFRRILSVSLLLLFVFPLAIATGHASAQGNLHTATQQELDVIKILLKQEAAWNRGDIEAFTQTYKDSPDTLFISKSVSRGFAGLVAEYHHDYPTRDAMGTLSFSELEVHSLDEKFAVCIGKYHLDRSKKEGGNAEGLFSLILEKTDQGWKIVVDHTT